MFGKGGEARGGGLEIGGVRYGVLPDGDKDGGILVEGDGEGDGYGDGEGAGLGDKSEIECCRYDDS